MVKFQPVIKWSGSKRSQSEQIVSLFPKEIDTYYEPFLGGGSIMFQLLNSNIKVNNYVCSDLNQDLISLWNAVKYEPNILIEKYETLWNELSFDNNIERRKEFYFSVRKKFNETRNPSLFLFLSRTCINGLIRYNGKGDFNTSLHLSRDGIVPDTLSKIILSWNEKLVENDVLFTCCSYSTINTNENDFMYLDPPYAGVKGMYYGTIDYDKLWNWLGEQKGKYILSFDGKCGKENRTYDVPVNLYSDHLYLGSGLSTFKKVRYDSVEDVQESLYIK